MILNRRGRTNVRRCRPKTADGSVEAANPGNAAHTASTASPARLSAQRRLREIQVSEIYRLDSQHQSADGMIRQTSNNDWCRAWRCLSPRAVSRSHRRSRVIPYLYRHFAHQLDALPARPLRDWGKFRWQDNALSIIWLYDRIGNPKLLIWLLHRQGHDWQVQSRTSCTPNRSPEFIKLNEGQESRRRCALHSRGKKWPGN
jgi:hypothetical protein